MNETIKLGLITWDRCNTQEKLERLRAILQDITKFLPGPPTSLGSYNDMTGQEVQPQSIRTPSLLD